LHNNTDTLLVIERRYTSL